MPTVYPVADFTLYIQHDVRNLSPIEGFNRAKREYMSTGSFWEIVWKVWKLALAGVGFLILIILLTLWSGSFLFSLGIIVPGIVGGVTVYLYAKASRSRTSSDEIPANHVTSLGGSVGGKVEIQSESIVFTPNKMERYLRRKPFKIPYEDIESIEKVSRLEDGFVAIFKRNGLSNRIRLELEDGTQEWFTVSDLESAAEKLSEAIQEC